MTENTTTPVEETKTSFWKKPIVRQTLIVASAVVGVTIATIAVSKKVGDAVPFEEDTVEITQHEDGSMTVRETTTTINA